MQTVWHELLAKASIQRKVRQLLTIAAAAEPTVATRIDEFAAGEPVIEAALPATNDGIWKGFDDREALEKQVFDDYTLLDIAFLQRGVELAAAVARLSVVQPTQAS
jgi:endonuclease G